MASHTATNLATLSSSGPKVIARGRSRPTSYQPHRFNRMSSVQVAGPLLHKRCSQWFHRVFRTTDTGKCCATSPASAVPSVVSLIMTPLCLLITPPPLLYPVVFQAWTLEVWAATSMTRSPVPWPSPEPLRPPSASFLLASPHRASTTVLPVARLLSLLFPFHLAPKPN